MKVNLKHFFYQGTIPAALLILTVAITSCSSPATPTASPQTTAPVPAPPVTSTPAPTQRQGASGTLESINGNILTLTTSQGQVLVNAGSNTVIEKVITAALQDLSAGQFLSVTGIPDSMGAIVATNIMVRPAGQNVPFPSANESFTGSGRRPFGTFNGTGTTSSGNFTRPSFNGTSPDIRRPSSGTISAINGSTLTLTTTQSPPQQITVTVSPTTIIEETVRSSLMELNPGSFLTVFGNAGANGAIDAISITDGQQGGGFRFGPGGN